jgi:geranylgeranyl pyrophosphate synthase
MDREEVKAKVLDLPELNTWSVMADIFERVLNRSSRDCEWPQMACQAVGGDESIVPAAAAAMVCMKIGITMVDDILDEDPRGLYHQMGPGAASNLALAFQAAAFGVIAKMPLDAERRAAGLASLAQMALTTAFGQSLDVQNLPGEENYWKIVRTKSTPYYATAMQIGAVLGGANLEIASRLRTFGAMNGEVVQLYDDLTDVLEQPANPDWKQGRNNLLILYAMSADHPEREKFKTLLPQIDDLEALKTAQQILVRCGAVSYCAYHVVKRHEAARRLIDSMPVVDPAPLRRLVSWYIAPLVSLLRNVGASVPPELEMV